MALRRMSASIGFHLWKDLTTSPTVVLERLLRVRQMYPITLTDAILSIIVRAKY